MQLRYSHYTNNFIVWQENIRYSENNHQEHNIHCYFLYKNDISALRCELCLKKVNQTWISTIRSCRRLKAHLFATKKPRPFREGIEIHFLVAGNCRDNNNNAAKKRALELRDNPETLDSSRFLKDIEEIGKARFAQRYALEMPGYKVSTTLW